MIYNMFPTLTGLTFDRKKVPNWNTAKQITVSGTEFRTGYRLYPLNEFDLSYSYFSLVDKQTMEGFFNAQQGALIPFYYDNDNDDTISTPFQFGTSDGVTSSWPLYHPAGSGAIQPVGGQTGTFGTVTAPGVTVLFDNGTAIPTTHYSLSDNGKGGIVTFGSGYIPVLGHVMTWTGTYYYLVRFVEDTMEFNEFANKMYELQECKLMEVR